MTTASLDMMTSSNWNFPSYSPFVRGIHRTPVDSSNKGQWRGALVFSLICAWTNAWANNRDACDLRRNRAHYKELSETRQNGWPISFESQIVWWTFSRRLFLIKKYENFDYKFYWSLFLKVLLNIGLDNGLAQSMRQVVVRTNDV